MSATQTPVRIQSLPPIASEPQSMKELRDAIVQAIALLPKPELDVAFDAMDNEPDPWQHEPEASIAIDTLYEAVADELAPAVAKLIDEAVARRLPWQWPE